MKQRQKRKIALKHKYYKSLMCSFTNVFKRSFRFDLVNTSGSLMQYNITSEDKVLRDVLILKMKKYQKVRK